jgi:hypothetical protein
MIQINAPLFSDEFFGACMDFQNLCFETYGGWGQDAKLRTEFRRRRESRTDWNPEWASYFSENPCDPQKIRSAYKRVMEAFANDIGIHSPPTVPLSGRLPLNIQ